MGDRLPTCPQCGKTMSTCEWVDFEGSKKRAWCVRCGHTDG